MPASDAEVVPLRTGSNLAALATAAAAARPDQEAVVDSRRRLTWAGLERERTASGSGLSALGLVAGHRVAILLANRVELVTTYLGAVGAGLVAVPLNPAAPTGEVVRMLADAQVRAVVCDHTTVTSTRAAVGGLAEALQGADEELRSRVVVPQVVVVDSPAVGRERAYHDLVATQARSTPPPQDPETLAALLYTAGTGGRPRAAMLSHRALLANVEQAAALSPPPLSADDRVLAALPLCHVHGLTAVLGQVLRQQACLVLADGQPGQEPSAAVAAESVTALAATPAALDAWSRREDLREALAGVRTVTSGVAPLPAPVAERFARACGLPVHQGYGLAEAGMVTTTLGAPHPKSGSVGRPLPGVRLRVADEGGEPVEPGDPGEVWVCGAGLFSGYWPVAEGGPDADGWYATGDIGYLDADGDLFLVDRVQDVVVVSGFTVYPAEVEAVVAEVAGVQEAAVVGADDPGTGQAVVAYVVPEPFSRPSAERLTDEVLAHCRDRLAPFKRPRDVRVVDELPHALGGRVARGRLRGHERRRAMGLA